MVETFLLHGGAGKWDQREERGQQAIEDIADTVERECSSKNALETVEYAVKLLEENREFNAGRGAKFQADGEIRLDASIMKSDLETGSVIGLEGEFLHPISIARKVMEKTHHVALKGEQAEEFAEQLNFQRADLEEEYRKEKLEEVRNKVKDLSLEKKVEILKERGQKGTVGAVALDSEGRMASATSTGGVHGQMAGRVGDTPMPGCGTYCNQKAAVSATGIGEAIIKTTLTRRCTELMERGEKPSDAVKRALRFLEEKTGETAGLIAIREDGRTAANFNSKQMVWAERTEI